MVNVGFDLRGRGSCGVSTRRIMCGWSSERKGDLLGSRRVRRTLIEAAPRDSLRKSSIPCPYRNANTTPLISPPNLCVCIVHETHPMDFTFPPSSSFSISFHVSTNVGDEDLGMNPSSFFACGQCIN